MNFNKVRIFHRLHEIDEIDALYAVVETQLRELLSQVSKRDEVRRARTK